MKHLKFLAGCILCFALGTFVPSRNVHAQAGDSSPATKTYYLISFLKSKDGIDALKMERDLWKPVANHRLTTGAIDSWTVMEPMFFGPHPYDYMTVETSSNMEQLTSIPNIMASMDQAWGKDKVKDNSDQTMKARDQVGNELWVKVDGVARPIK